METIIEDRNIAGEKLPEAKKSNKGFAMAAILSGAIGCFVLGAAIVLAQYSPVVKTFLTWSKPVGPLAGKTGVGIIAWLVSFFILIPLWKDKPVNEQSIMKISYILLILAFLFSFPTFFELFGH